MTEQQQPEPTDYPDSFKTPFIRNLEQQRAEQKLVDAARAEVARKEAEADA